MRSSRSCAICTGYTFDRPLRARRGLSAASRWPETSNAYRRPVLRISAPSASVLPPAPAQKSATISPRLAPVSSASSWLPSSCTSTSPRRKTSSLCSGGLPGRRRPTGEYGVGSAAMPASASAACAFSRRDLKRVDAQVQPGRLVERVDEAPELLDAEFGLQSLGQPVGQVVAQPLGQRRAIDRLHLLQPLHFGRRECGAQEGRVALPGEQHEAALDLALARLREVLPERLVAQHARTSSRPACGARARRADAGGGRSPTPPNRPDARSAAPGAAIRWRVRRGR